MDKIKEHRSMKYLNASDILPDKLLQEVQKYTQGKALYIPKTNERRKWGEGSGARNYYEQRNEEIQKKFARDEVSIEELATEYYLSIETIRKILYK
jgi:Mor family transcriptional regulator